MHAPDDGDLRDVCVPCFAGGDTRQIGAYEDLVEPAASGRSSLDCVALSLFRAPEMIFVRFALSESAVSKVFSRTVGGSYYLYLLHVVAAGSRRQ